MSKLEELIQQYCPDGVEYVKLASITDIDIGEFVRQDKQGDEKPYPVFNGGRTNTGMYDEYNHDGNYILISARGANAGFVNKITGRYWAGNSCYSIGINPEKIDFEFAYHYLKNAEKKLLGVQQKGSIPAVSKKQVMELEVPLPAMPVQREIAQILGEFSLLSAELSAELAARQKQYSFYCDKLLIFNTDYKEYKLADICKIYDGTHQTPDYKESGVKFASVENIKNVFETTKYISEEDFEKYKIKPELNDILMTRIGDIGTCYVIDKIEPLAYYVSLALLRPDNKIVNSKFLKYMIESSIGRKELRKRTLVNAVPIKINKDDIGKLILPIPSLKTQEKIVKILDNFYSLTNGISDGIPAEIEARQKQYEYYRDRLLTFKRKES